MSKITDIGYVGKAKTSAKIKTNSNILSRNNGSIDFDSIESVRSFSEKHLLDTATKGLEKLEDDRLLKYTASKMVSKENASLEVYLISDEAGHDIGTYDVKNRVFKLSPDIENKNKEVLKSAMEQEIPVSGDVEKLLVEPSMENVLERLAKGESLVLKDVNDVKNEMVKAASKGMGDKNEGELMSTKQNDSDEDLLYEEEKEALNNIPADLVGQVIEMCKEKNIRIKEILVVDCPDCMEEEISDGDTPINARGGPVIMVKAISGGTKEDIHLFQDGNHLPPDKVDRNKDRLLELMDQHKGERAVTELEDTREDEILKQLEEATRKYEEEVAKYNSSDFESEEMREQAIEQAGKNLAAEKNSILADYTPDPDGMVSNYSRTIDEITGNEDNEREEEAERTNTNDSRDDDTSEGRSIFDDHDHDHRFAPYN